MTETIFDIKPLSEWRSERRRAAFLEANNLDDLQGDHMRLQLAEAITEKQQTQIYTLTAQLARVTAQRDALRRLVYVLLPLMPVLSEIVAMRDEVADALAAADKAMRND